MSSSWTNGSPLKLQLVFNTKRGFLRCSATNNGNTKCQLFSFNLFKFKWWHVQCLNVDIYLQDSCWLLWQQHSLVESDGYAPHDLDWTQSTCFRCLLGAVGRIVSCFGQVNIWPFFLVNISNSNELFQRIQRPNVADLVAGCQRWQLQMWTCQLVPRPLRRLRSSGQRSRSLGHRRLR